MRMTSIERIGNILSRKPVDRVGVFENFWVDTTKKWVKEGKIRENENLSAHFGLDIERYFPFNSTADLDYKPQTIEETEETIIVRNGNGALLRHHKQHVSTPEHVDFMVKERAPWEEYAKPLLKPERRRINFEGYRKARQQARENNRFFLMCDSLVFEKMKALTGHEHLLVGMALDPEWVSDMVSLYADLLIALMEILFTEEGCPDGLYFPEDLGFKDKPFISPQMYKELIQPAHKKIIDFVHSYNLPVIIHSCGFVEPLVPGFIEAGIDCLQPMEIKAGMDPLKLYKLYGEKISFMGGMDVTVLSTNDREKVLRELESKLPIIKGNYGYILQSDHSIPDTIEYDTYRYFLEKGLEIGIY